LRAARVFWNLRARMKISTWNVNGIRAREAQVLDWLARERPDVLCLQEIKASPEHVPPSLCELEGYWCAWHGHKGYSGVGLHLRKEIFPWRPRFTHPPFDTEHRIVTAEVEDVVLASIYVPNGNKDYPAKVRFLEALEAWVAAEHAAGRKLILCGDLNVARSERDVHPKLRKPNVIGQTPEEQAILERILARGLVDLGRRFDPDNDRLFTWWAPWRNLRERNIGWRLDYVLASDALAERALGCGSHREFGTSDHGPVVAVFDGPVAVMTGPPPPAAPEPEPEPAAEAKPGQLALDLTPGSR
jgi:exodeoxyribonuclease III